MSLTDLAIIKKYKRNYLMSLTDLGPGETILGPSEGVAVLAQKSVLLLDACVAPVQKYIVFLALLNC